MCDTRNQTWEWTELSWAQAAATNAHVHEPYAQLVTPSGRHGSAWLMLKIRLLELPVLIERLASAWLVLKLNLNAWFVLIERLTSAWLVCKIKLKCLTWLMLEIYSECLLNSSPLGPLPCMQETKSKFEKLCPLWITNDPSIQWEPHHFE